MNQLSKQTQELGLSQPKKGLLDLPGELRNDIYEHLLKSSDDDHTSESTQEFDPDILKTALALTSTNRQLRTEFRPFFFQHVEIPLAGNELEHILVLFFPTGTALNSACNLHIEFDAADLPDTDIEWLIQLAQERPEVKLKFDGDMGWEAHAGVVNKLLDAVRSKDAWRTRLSDFAFKEIHYKLGCLRTWDDPKWELKLVLEEGVLSGVDDVLVNFGLHTVDDKERWKRCLIVSRSRLLGSTHRGTESKKHKVALGYLGAF
ncbi:hypothetical protein CC86DRAFT_424374 [Ophiobolus disseminans]|uniref:F-box domain-containing protein n=1 Tax=Ophiobolus disseminans TaxID=1469910 RepID=A0A6A7AH74_9PLEO|nr:hypothetical protein CC86DRAFT_424374 [Ophiobolus disseminans]